MNFPSPRQIAVWLIVIALAAAVGIGGVLLVQHTNDQRAQAQSNDIPLFRLAGTYVSAFPGAGVRADAIVATHQGSPFRIPTEALPDTTVTVEAWSATRTSGAVALPAGFAAQGTFVVAVWRSGGAYSTLIMPVQAFGSEAATFRIPGNLTVTWTPAGRRLSVPAATLAYAGIRR